MLFILKKELSSFFNSLIAYIVIGVFLLFTGLLFWLYPDTNILDYGYADLDSFFSIVPYLFLFLVPAITMRMFSEEIKSGTIELLLTKPVTVTDIILGKFLSCVVIVILTLLPTLIYYFTLYNIGNPVGNIDSAAVAGSYCGLILLGAAFASVGLFMSSKTENQVVAFLLTAIIGYILFLGLEQFSGLFSGGIQYYISYLSMDFHYKALSKGVIDSRDIIYFVSIIVIFLLLTLINIDRFRS